VIGLLTPAGTKEQIVTEHANQSRGPGG
jgi:hypothetical protein